MRVLPQSYYMYKKAKIPCAVFATPFAEPVSMLPSSHPQDINEDPIPRLTCPHGLVRCSECW